MADEPEIDAAAFRARLEAREAELDAQIEATASDREAVELDQQRVGRLSRMDALQAQAMALEAERRRKVEIERVDAALARIKDGTYGDCVTCGGPIGLERLDLDPATPFCIDCAR